MRIVQLIDSLDVGGAERMAVNFANALSQQISFSGLVTTRKEGGLKNEIVPAVDYFFLKKDRTVDISAILRFRSYCKKNEITIVHAHGSSFFTAFLLKLTLPNVQIVWHDHNGDRSSQSKKQNIILSFCVRFFSGIIVVNHKLEEWMRAKLNADKVIYLPNFTVQGNVNDKKTSLYGNSGRRILYLANLRYPKNHLMLLAVAEKIKLQYPDWSFHLVGKDLNDQYSDEIKRFITANGLRETVYIYGLKTDTRHIIGQADIAVIASSYEGLPVSLLEYGLYRKAVVVTNVGEIPMIVDNGKNGFLTESDDVQAFCGSLLQLIADESLRTKFGDALFETISENHSEASIVKQYMNWVTAL